VLRVTVSDVSGEMLLEASGAAVFTGGACDGSSR
jgi:hypothetical protein